VTADKDLEARHTAIENLIKPLAENLGKFDHQISEIEKAREGAYQAITEQVQALGESQVQLHTEAGRWSMAFVLPNRLGVRLAASANQALTCRWARALPCHVKVGRLTDKALFYTRKVSSASRGSRAGKGALSIYYNRSRSVIGASPGISN
jgi:hypothetical protein